MTDSSASPVAQTTDTANLTETEARLRASRLAKLEKLKQLGHNPYPYKYDVTARATELRGTYADLADDTVTGDTVRIAGRVRALRNSGMFIDLHDVTGKIQVFCHKDFLPAEGQAILECLDIGDLIGVEGLVRRTKRGELTINAKVLTVLSKTLLPLPDKFHGLADTEACYRQRYLDLIMNEDSREVFRKRSAIIQSVRNTLIGRGFMEVETPILQLIPGGGAAKPFLARYNALDTDVYMRIAPELFLKRIIVGGLSERVFEIGRNFRNEGLSPRHNPEFTMLEAYQAFTDYEGMIELTEALLQAAAIAATGSDQVQFGDQILSFKPPFRRASMTELVKEETGVDFLAINTVEEARAAAKKLGCPISGKENWGQCVEMVFGEKVEPGIVQPTHVCDQPRDISPLAKVHKTDPRLTERFETFCVGREIANAFSELSDPQDQLARFEDQVAQRDTGDDEAMRMDRDYVTALEYGLPPTGGMGMGIDRLIMLMTNSQTIRDVLLFPTLKPLD